MELEYKSSGTVSWRRETFAFLMRYSGGKPSCSLIFYRIVCISTCASWTFRGQCQDSCIEAHFDFEPDILELEGVSEAEAQVEILQIKSIVLEYIEPGHSIA